MSKPLKYFCLDIKALSLSAISSLPGHMMALDSLILAAPNELPESAGDVRPWKAADCCMEGVSKPLDSRDVPLAR